MNEPDVVKIAAAIIDNGELLQLRDHTGTSQFVAAYECGVSLPTWGRWEHGKSHPQSQSMARKLVDYADVLRTRPRHREAS